MQEQLAELRSSELLYEVHSHAELSYSFKHALIHDVAYQGMLLERRRSLHARLVGTIEKCYRDRLSEHMERLAHHAWIGEVWEKAAAYLHQAGDRAIQRCAYRQAAAFFRQAMAALARLPASETVTAQAIDIRIRLRPALMPIGESDQVLSYLLEAEQLASTAGDRARLVLVLIHQSYFHSVHGAIPTAVSTAHRASDIASTIDDKPLAVETRIALGQAYCYGGESFRAIEVQTPDLDCLIREFRHDRFGQIGVRSVVALHHVATAHDQLGDFAAAINLRKSALIIAEEVNRPFDVATACYGLGSSMLLKGEIEDALPFLERGRAISGMAEISYMTLWLAAMIGYAHALRGEGDQARTLLEQTIERSTALHLIRHEAQARTFLSYASQRCNAWPEAAEHARQALHLAQRHNYLDLEVMAYRLLGTVENVGDNSSTSEGEGHLRKAVALAESLAMRPELAHSHHGLGNFLSRTERREEARQHLASALALYRTMDMRFWQQQVEAILAVD